LLMNTSYKNQTQKNTENPVRMDNLYRLQMIKD